jgi:exodeoxyribonuclease III
MRVITINLNSIRSAVNKGFLSWLNKQNADIVCMQETRAHQSQLTDAILRPDNYYAYFVYAKKKGYSGVGIYTKIKPNNVISSLGWENADSEARYLQIDFDNLSIISIYVPSGTSGDERQNIKYDFMDKYLQVLKKQIKDGRSYIICGDFNIAHKEIDLKNWRSNQKNSGFLPAERAWLDKVFNEIGFIDGFRYKYPTKVEYTWWSNFANAWENNVGWRIDYQIVTPDVAPLILDAKVYREEKFSDHAPLIVDYVISPTASFCL